MMRRFLAAGTALLISASILVLAPGGAIGFTCAPDEDDDLRFEKMIDQGTTGDGRYPAP